MEPLETEKIETDAGTYVMQIHHDGDAEPPYDEGFGFAFNGRPTRCIDAATGAHASEVLSIIRYHTAGNQDAWRGEARSAAAVARYLRLKYGLKGVLEVTGDYQTREPSMDRGERIAGIAWAPDDAEDPAAYTRSGVARYQAWAHGEVFGWVLLAPDGTEVDACWGYYGDDDDERVYMRQAAEAEARYDAAWRVVSACRVGAGFIGII